MTQDTDTNDGELPPMNIQQADPGDHVREAINRAEYWPHKAVGEVDGYEVLVSARVTESTATGGFAPLLTVHVDGEWKDGVYLGGASIAERYDSLHSLDRDFGRLSREYDLEVLADG
jgi:hypothetical protein